MYWIASTNLEQSTLLTSAIHSNIAPRPNRVHGVFTRFHFHLGLMMALAAPDVLPEDGKINISKVPSADSVIVP